MIKGENFYSSNDLGCLNNLSLLEQVTSNCESSIEYDDINEILEFFNIQKYFDNKCYLKKM